MLAIQARSFSNYFYLQSNNSNQPSNFIDNKVTGILFENKVDHASMYILCRHIPSPFPSRLCPLARRPQNTLTHTHINIKNLAFNILTTNSIFRHSSAISPRHPHAAPIPRLLLPTSQALRPRGMGPLLQSLPFPRFWLCVGSSG